MSIVKRIVAILLSVVLGLIFLYSGYSKLQPVIETFEFTFVDIGVANWYTAPVIARLLIGLELFLGVLLVACYHLRRFTLPVTIGLLSFFVIYLAVQIAISGNSGNCGCFGERLRMTPLQGIIKNLIMIGMALIVFVLYNGWKVRLNRLVLALVGTTAVIVPFVINPIDYAYTSNNLDEKVNYPLELNLLYQPEDTAKVQVPTIDLRKGKHVVAFISLTCHHCRIAAKKFRLIKKNNPNLSIYFVMNGDRSVYPTFINDTKADNIPATYCLGKPFVQLATTHLPRIYYLENGMVVKKVDYFELNQYDLEQWMGK